MTITGLMTGSQWGDTIKLRCYTPIKPPAHCGGEVQRSYVYSEREIPNNAQYEVTTKWLGEESKLMNVALWSPSYDEKPNIMLMCVYPGGWFEISAC